MVTLNLLPWRDKQAQYEKRNMLKIVIAAAIFSLLIVIITDRCFWYQESVVLNHIKDLKKELEWREGLAKVNAASSQSAAQLGGNLLSFFKALSQSNKNGVCFEKIKKTKGQIEFVGLTNSAVGLTDFLRTSPLISYFSEVKVLQLQNQQENQVRFNFVGKLHAI